MTFRNPLRRPRGRSPLMMTPMIDIVFQLLVFFIMTFKIVAPEGDFRVDMPVAVARSVEPSPVADPPLRLHLQASKNGALAGMRLNDRPLVEMADLRAEVRQIADSRRSRGSELELELHCDYGLRYEHTIDAVTAVSGFVTDDGREIVPLIERISFRPPSHESP